MKKLLIPATIALLTACTTMPSDPNMSHQKTKQGAATGAAIGAIAGAIIGHNQDSSGGALRGALVGAAAGGLTGGTIGAYMDKQQYEFEQQLAAERSAHQMEVQRLQNENLKITMNGEVSFDFNSAALKPGFKPTLDKVADILIRYPQTNVEITGHTDNVGPADYNQKLSEQRAISVARYLERKGVAQGRISAIGRGEWEPRESNDTEAGRQLNRRVELLIVPIQG